MTKKELEYNIFKITQSIGDLEDLIPELYSEYLEEIESSLLGLYSEIVTQVKKVK